MSDIKMRAQRSFEAQAVGWPLAQLADGLLAAYPDPYVLANNHAQRILKQHTGKHLDPRFVWWHQFDTASSSSRTFTGWQHTGQPLSSVSLLELIIHRFDAHFQEAPDDLDLYGGFYTQGPRAGRFDERNEVPLLGSVVQAELWELDFAVLYRHQVERFLAEHGDDFRVLAKVTLLGAGRQALLDGSITATDLARLRMLVIAGLAPGQMPNLAQLREQSTSTVFTIKRCVLAEGARDCFYSLQASDGRVLLWLPWATHGLRAFADELAMAGWLRMHLRDDVVFAAYLDAALDNPRDPEARRQVRATLQDIAGCRSAEAALAVVRFKQLALADSLFARMALQAGAEMTRSAESMLSNADLRKAMVSGYLSVFLNLFAGFTPLGWPVGFTVLGATLGKVALDVDAAARAQDTQARQAALRQAMLESLFGALYLADFGFQSSFALLTFQAPLHEVHASLDHWRPVEAPGRLLPELNVNEVVLMETITEGPMRAVQVRPDGSCWIVMDGLTYRVRYSHEQSTWLIVPPDNPFAFAPLRPVRLDANGEWALLEPPRLAGGNPPVGGVLHSETSALWEEYVNVDNNSSQIISARALWRQKRVLKAANLRMLGPAQVPDVDAHGLDCVLENGVPVYSYQDANGRYYNSLIEYYTDSDAKINDVFRSGTYRYGDEHDYIKDLADSLELLPRSNAVHLYRGGREARGTGGLHLRQGTVGVGDVLVNTDFTSFTENPYMAPGFAADLISDGDQHWSFDDSSVIYQLSAGEYQGAVPISAFSTYWDEAETLFLPGRYFRIDEVKQLYGEHYRLIWVLLREVSKPEIGTLYDLRTGQPFNRAVLGERLRDPVLLDRFFPA